jgi:hypothetical protein
VRLVQEENGETLEIQEPLEQLDPKVKVDSLGHQDLQDQLDRKEHQASKDNLGSRVLKGPLVQGGKMASQVHLVNLVSVVLLVLQDH